MAGIYIDVGDGEESGATGMSHTGTTDTQEDIFKGPLSYSAMSIKL